MPPTPLNPRPLIVRFGAMGDMVLLTVMIRALHARFGMPVDLVSSGTWTLPLLQDQPGVGEIFLIGSRRTPYWLSPEQRALVQRLRRRQPGPVWLCESDPVKPLALLQRAGFDASLICQSNDYPRRPGEHFADRWARFARTQPAALHDVPASPSNDAFSKLVVSAQTREQSAPWLEHFGNGRPILIQAGNKRTMRKGSRQRASNTKYWPEASWAQVLQGLRTRHPNAPLLLLGVPQEAPLNDDILGIAQVGNAHNVAKDVPIPRLLALAERAAGMISVDSGPAHVAAAVGCPVVTLFGKADPALYVPRGPQPWSVAVTGLDHGEPSLLGVTPNDALQAWDALQARARGAGA